MAHVNHPSIHHPLISLVSSIIHSSISVSLSPSHVSDIVCVFVTSAAKTSTSRFGLVERAGGERERTLVWMKLICSVWPRCSEWNKQQKRFYLYPCCHVSFINQRPVEFIYELWSYLPADVATFMDGNKLCCCVRQLFTTTSYRYSDPRWKSTENVNFELRWVTRFFMLIQKGWGGR